MTRADDERHAAAVALIVETFNAKVVVECRSKDPVVKEEEPPTWQELKQKLKHSTNLGDQR